MPFVTGKCEVENLLGVLSVLLPVSVSGAEVTVTENIVAVFDDLVEALIVVYVAFVFASGLVRGINTVFLEFTIAATFGEEDF